MKKYFLLADIGGTTISTMIVDRQGKSLNYPLKRPTYRYLPKTKVLDNIASAFRATIKQASISERELIRLLVAMPTRMDKKGNIIPCPNLPTLGDINLTKEIENLIQLPVFAGSDSHSFAAGELVAGCAGRVKHFCGITLGTGVGLAFFLNKKPFFGSQGLAGEIWKSAYLDGVWEDYVSSNFIQSIYKECTGETLEVREIAQRAFVGEKKAKEVFVRFGINLANGLTYVINILDPELIVFGGSISKSFKLFKEATIKTIKNYLVKGKKIIIKASDHPDISSLIGIKWLYERQ